MKPSKTLALASVLLMISSVSACASLGDRFSFLKKKEQVEIKKDNERIAILPFDHDLKIDEAASKIAINIPDAHNITDWPNIGGIPSGAPLNIKGDGSLQIAWTRSVGVGAPKKSFLIAPPIIGNGIIYTLDGAMNVHANNKANGQSIWSKSLAKREKKGFFKPTGQAIGGGIAFDDGKIFVSSGFGEILALDAQTGDIIWTKKTNGPVHSAPLASNGKVYIVTVESELLALNQADGSVHWTQSSIPEMASMLTTTSSAIFGETIITPFASGEIIASLQANGRKLWSDGLTRMAAQTSLSSINDIAGRPVIYEGVVYAVSQSGTFAAVDLRTGVRIWDKSISSIQTPWVTPDVIYCVTISGQLVAMSREKGDIIWIKQLEAYKNLKKKKNKIVWSGPIMVSSRLVIASTEGEILEIDPKSGEVLNTITTKNSLYTSPAISEGKVYYYSNDAKLLVLQ